MPPEIHLDGPNRVNPNSPDVQRAIMSSVRIQSHDTLGTKTSESGNLVDLSAAQRASLGVSATDQIVLTDAHGVEKAHGEIMVQGTNDVWYAARILKLDDVRDLAFLKVEKLAPGVLPSVQIADKDDTAPGDMVFSVAHDAADKAISVKGGAFYGMTSKSAEYDRLGPGYRQTYEGIVNTLGTNDKADALTDFHRPLLQTGLGNKQGNSGGGLFNSSGKIIGVCEAVEEVAAPRGRDMYTPLRQIQTFETQAPKFNFKYGTEPFIFTGTTNSINVPALIEIDRVSGENRVPFNVNSLIESKFK